MSGKLMGEVYKLILPKSERELLLALCDHADDNGENCYPSVSHLAWKLNCSIRNVQVLLRHLESKKIIVPVSNLAGGRGKATEYKIILESGAQRPQTGERPTKSKYKTPHGYTLEKFGITEDQYDELYNSQSGLCAICKTESLDKRLAVDHDHQTGKIRGLLCSKCNTVIGLLRDDAELLSRAADYLKGEKGAEIQKGENPEKGEKGAEKRVKRVQEKGEKGAKTSIAYKEEPSVEPPVEPSERGGRAPDDGIPDSAPQLEIFERYYPGLSGLLSIFQREILGTMQNLTDCESAIRYASGNGIRGLSVDKIVNQVFKNREWERRNGKRESNSYANRESASARNAREYLESMGRIAG